MTRRPASVLAALTALLALPAAAHAIPGAAVCAHQPAFRCATVTVPVDRTGGVGGQIGLKVAYQPGSKPVLVALTGGPGQPGVDFASSFAESLAPATRRYRLAVLDQRGTGGSGLLRCDALQRLTTLAPYTPDDIAACGLRIGARRAFYGTVDSVADIDALRQALGVDRIALMGVSYGTYVAAQYARIHPDRVDRLILDSAVGPGGVDPLSLDTYARMPRVLGDLCDDGACDGVTSNPIADVEAVVDRLHGGRPLSATVRDHDGRARTVRISRAPDIATILGSADLSPGLLALLPGAMAAAHAGDAAPLVRLRPLADGGVTAARDLSVGLNVTTACDDGVLPYALGDTRAVRAAKLDAAAAAVPASARGPFSPADIIDGSVSGDCLAWPATPLPAGPSSAPLPDVPALILGGGQDMRTPIENGRALAALMPRAAVVEVPGNGHDELDTDATGCAVKALSRFIAGTAVGHPCAGRSDQPTLAPRPPLRLRQVPRAVGVSGDRGRIVTTARLTLRDAVLYTVAHLDAGLPYSTAGGGGVRGGYFRARLTDRTARVSLHAVQWLKGVRVTGTVDLDAGTGRLRIDGPGRLDGTLTLRSSGNLAGRLGGRPVRGRSAAARAAGTTSSHANALGLGPLPRLPDRPASTLPR